MSEDDRMSALPDAVLHQILSFLLTKQSIRTSILSKRWINLWKFSPVIDIRMTGPRYQITPSDINFIHNTLSQHQAMKLHKFRLDFSTGKRYPKFDVQRCTEFAISRKIHILSLSVEYLFFGHKYYVLPNMFYSHDNLRSLEQVSLKGFSFNADPPKFLPLASLETLCFFDCAIDDETLKALLSNCPVLETLTIESCPKLRNVKASWCQSMRLKHLILRCKGCCGLNLEIDVSSVSTFKVYGVLVSNSFGSSSSIVEATVFQWSYFYLQEFQIGTWLQNLAHVKKLGVDSWFSKFLAREHKGNSNGWNIFENLKVFSWFGSLRKERNLVALIAFLSHCPSLETIEIDFRHSSYYWEEGKESRAPFDSGDSFIELENGDEQVTVGFLHNVKEIMVHHFFGSKSEMEFIKHLLQKSIVLETLSLTYHRLEFNPETYIGSYHNGRPKELVEEEIFSLPRASSLVHILFHDTYHKVGFHHQPEMVNRDL